MRQLRGEALMFRRDVLDQVMLTSDPTVRAVFAEDAAGIAGDLIALVGVGRQQATGSPTPDILSALLIGLLLIGVGIQLAHGFETGVRVHCTRRRRAHWVRIGSCRLMSSCWHASTDCAR